MQTQQSWVGTESPCGRSICDGLGSFWAFFRTVFFCSLRPLRRSTIHIRNLLFMSFALCVDFLFLDLGRGESVNVCPELDNLAKEVL